MLFISFNQFLLFSFFLFLSGILGIVLNKRNLLLILMSIELMLLGVNLNFIFFSVYIDDLIGQLFSLYILAVAASESAIGLAIFTIYYRDKLTTVLEKYLRARG